MVEARNTRAGTIARKNDELVAIVALGLVFQGLLSYLTYLDRGVVGIAAGFAAPYVTFVLLVGTVQGLVELPRFKVALFAGWAVLLGVGHAMTPSPGRLFVGGLAVVAAIHYARKTRYIEDAT